MKGTVVATWIKTCRNVWGSDVVDNAMTSVGWDRNKIFNPLEDVPDKEVNSFVDYISSKKGVNKRELWKTIGKDNLNAFHEGFPAFFKHDNLYHFLSSMYDVHANVAKRIPGAHPPLIQVTPISEDEAIFLYKSNRKMFDYLDGLLEGSAEYFKENIQIDELEKNDDSVELKIKFGYTIYEHKKYPLNNILSLGFIKSIEVKIALLSAIIALPFILIPSRFTDSKSIIYIISILGVLFSGGLSSFLLLMPKKIIDQEIESIMSNEYTDIYKLKTNDFFE